jgi:hypothetical protein
MIFISFHEQIIVEQKSDQDKSKHITITQQITFLEHYLNVFGKYRCMMNDLFNMNFFFKLINYCH